jgi:ribosomal-protein-alanine N-acetyltransferase
MTEDDARAVLLWRYPPPFDLYNAAPSELETAIGVMTDPQFAYHSICNERGDVEAFCCFGEDARVPGGDYASEALDLGLGVRPDLTGRGHGHVYVRAALGIAADILGWTVLRVTVAAFNTRALRVWEKAGFFRTATFQRAADDLAFIVLTRAAGS